MYIVTSSLDNSIWQSGLAGGWDTIARGKQSILLVCGPEISSQRYYSDIKARFLRHRGT